MCAERAVQCLCPSSLPGMSGAIGAPWQFRGSFERFGYYEMPLLEKQDIDVSELRLIRFSSIVKNETRDFDATVHFFEKDEKFDEVWGRPEAYLDELRQYRQVMTPDFSLYANWPVPVQMFNTFRSRWCGWYWQQHGLIVIPTVSWALRESFRFCFAGVPPCTTVAVSTVGCRDSEKGFMAGYRQMLKVLDPTCVINYGEPFDAMDGLAPLVVVPYRRTARVAPRLP